MYVSNYDMPLIQKILSNIKGRMLYEDRYIKEKSVYQSKIHNDFLDLRHDQEETLHKGSLY